MNPVRIAVWDADGAPMDWVGAPLSVRTTPRAAAPSEAVLVLASDDPQVGPLTAPGARAAVDLLVDPVTGTWDRLVVGQVAERSGDSRVDGQVELAVEDARSSVLGLLAHPDPAQAPTPGLVTTAGAMHRTLSGPAETVIKTLVGENATWSGMPVDVAPDLGRGRTVQASMRFAPLSDLWADLVAAGVVPVVDVAGPRWRLDVVETTTLPWTLTEASGIVQPGTWKLLPPTATRVLVLGQGEEADREVLLLVDEAAEADWAPRTVTVDARDVEVGNHDLLRSRGLARLAEGAATAQVSCALSETQDFRYGVTVRLGDQVQVQMSGAPLVASTVTEVAVTWDTSNGLLVVPAVGDTDVSFDQVVTAAVGRLARTLDKTGRMT